MNMLTTGDPEYRVAYYKAMKLDPDVSGRFIYEPETQPTYRGYPPPICSNFPANSRTSSSAPRIFNKARNQQQNCSRIRSKTRSIIHSNPHLVEVK